MLLVTGGAGFIGSNFVLEHLAASDEPVLTVDKLAYAGSRRHLASVEGDPRHAFVRADIAERAVLRDLFAGRRPRAVLHFAAETHVDRSIAGPDAFLHSNVAGTFHLLEETRRYWSGLAASERDAFRFLHVSTDEVYGSLGPDAAPFTESSPFAPNSPYAASKAASDHFVRAAHRTYGLPTLTTHCSNNYGPHQYPEKLIPLMIGQATREGALPVYGDGRHVRDWLYVRDHCAGLRLVLEKGRPGETYNLGGETPLSNLEVVKALCAVLDRLRPRRRGRYEELIAFVEDRPGHDRRYAMDIGKVRTELGWRPREAFASGLEKTVRWYLEHPESLLGPAAAE